MNALKMKLMSLFIPDYCSEKFPFEISVRRKKMEYMRFNLEYT